MASLLLLTAVCGCGSNAYVPPTTGPIGQIIISSNCTSRADFHARINRRRTETYGCNETARWPVNAGPVMLEIQVEEAHFSVAPMRVDIEVSDNECVEFLLRQSDGYQLEYLGTRNCE